METPKEVAYTKYIKRYRDNAMRKSVARDDRRIVEGITTAVLLACCIAVVLLAVLMPM